MYAQSVVDLKGHMCNYHMNGEHKLDHHLRSNCSDSFSETIGVVRTNTRVQHTRIRTTNGKGKSKQNVAQMWTQPYINQQYVWFQQIQIIISSYTPRKEKKRR